MHPPWANLSRKIHYCPISTLKRQSRKRHVKQLIPNHQPCHPRHVIIVNDVHAKVVRCDASVVPGDFVNFVLPLIMMVLWNGHFVWTVKE